MGNPRIGFSKPAPSATRPSLRLALCHATATREEAIASGKAKQDQSGFGGLNQKFEITEARSPSHQRWPNLHTLPSPAPADRGQSFFEYGNVIISKIRVHPGSSVVK